MNGQGSTRTRADSDSQTVGGGPRDLEVLGSIAWAGVLSTDQVQRLHFPSRRTAQRRLRALLDRGYVRAHLQSDALHFANVYTATALGLERVAETGAYPDGIPSVLSLPRRGKLPHALAVRDVFVAFVSAEREGRIRLLDFRFDSDLAREPEVRDAGVVPDALASVAGTIAEESLCVEVDRGSETTTTLRAKLQRWADALTSGRGLFGSAGLLLFVVQRQGRCSTLDRLVADAGLGERCRVLLQDELPSFLLGRYPRGGYAAPVRAARTSAPAESQAFRPVGELAATAFRPLGRG